MVYDGRVARARLFSKTTVFARNWLSVEERQLCKPKT